MIVYIGADWDSKKLKIYWQIRGQEAQKLIFQKPSHKEVKKLITSIKKKAGKNVEIIAVIEAGAPQWNALLHSNGVKVHAVNPKKSSQFRDSLQTSRAKDDWRDAKALLAMAQSPHHLQSIPQWTPPPTILTEIKALTKIQEEYSKKQTQAQQKLRSHLMKKMPILSLYIKEIDAKWVLAFLKEIGSSWKLLKLQKAKFERIISKTRFKKENYSELWEVLKESKVPFALEELDEIETLEMKILVEEVERYSQILSSVNKKMDQVIETLPQAQSLCKIPGIGRVCSLVLLTTYSKTSPNHRDSLSIQMGCSPIFIGSGSTRTGQPKGYVSRRLAINNHLKWLSYLIGLQLTKNSRWGKAMFLDGKERGQRTGTIFRRITRSFLRIVNSMLKNGAEYDEDRYIQCLQKKGVPWAQSLSQQLSV